MKIFRKFKAIHYFHFHNSKYLSWCIYDYFNKTDIILFLININLKFLCLEMLELVCF